MRIRFRERSREEGSTQWLLGSAVAPSAETDGPGSATGISALPTTVHHSSSIHNKQWEREGAGARALAGQGRKANGRVNGWWTAPAAETDGTGGDPHANSDAASIPHQQQAIGWGREAYRPRGGAQKGEEKLTSIGASFVALELICTKCAYFS